MKNTNTTNTTKNETINEKASVFDQITESVRTIETDQAKDLALLKDIQGRINARVELLYNYSDALAKFARAIEVMADDYDDTLIDEDSLKNYTFEQCLSIAECEDDEVEEDDDLDNLDSIDDLEEGEDEGEEEDK